MSTFFVKQIGASGEIRTPITWLRRPGTAPSAEAIWRKTRESNSNPFGLICFRNSYRPSLFNLPRYNRMLCLSRDSNPRHTPSGPACRKFGCRKIVCCNHPRTWRKMEESNPGQLSPTACFPNRCSNHTTASSIGTPGQIRTANQQILSLSALPISVQGHIQKHTPN